MIGQHPPDHRGHYSWMMEEDSAAVVFHGDHDPGIALGSGGGGLALAAWDSVFAFCILTCWVIPPRDSSRLDEAPPGAKEANLWFTSGSSSSASAGSLLGLVSEPYLPCADCVRCSCGSYASYLY